MAQLTQAAVAHGGATSVLFTTPFPHRPGDKGRDRDGNEYVFVDYTATVYHGTLVQITSDYKASPLLGTTAESYRVGVVSSGRASTVSGDHPTSDNGGWVQVYGTHVAVQTGAASGGLVSDSTVGGYWCIPQTSVGTPSGTFSLILQLAGTSIAQASSDGNVIYGMWLVPMNEVTALDQLVTNPAASGASGPCSANEFAGLTSGPATSAFIGNSYTVFLNYPYVLGNTQPLSDATS